MLDLATHPLVRNFKPRPFDCGSVINLPRLTGRQQREADELNFADRMNRRAHGNQCSATTGMWEELMFVNSADYTAFNTSSSEGSLLAGGNNEQPVLPALFFFNKQGRQRTIRLTASGVIGSTSTPTVIFQLRLGTTSGSSYLSGASIGVTAAITMASGVSNKFWFLQTIYTLYTPGIGSGNATLSGAGFVMSPGGFASPFIYPLEITTPDTATWTQTLDNSVTQYVNLSATFSASSSSNTCTVKQLLLEGMN
jgi:hypothetical protein